MKQFVGILMVFGLLFTPIVFGEEKTSTAPLLGVWVPKEKDSHIQVYEEGGQFFGKVIWIQEKDAGKLDEKNPDDKLKSLKSFKEDEPGKKWNDGTVYDPHNGKTYSAKITYKENDTLELRGFVGIPLFGRTETWTRFKE